MDQPSASESRSGTFGAWGALAGLVGSLCCIGPSAAVLLGLGSSSALFGIQLSQSLALALSGALLLCGIVLGLRRRRACELRPGMRLRPAVLMLVTFALSYGLLGVLAPTLAAQREDAAQPAVVAVAAPASAPTLRRATLIVEKMECPPCAAAVRTLLKRKAYIHHFVAETYNQQVIIEYDSNQIDAQALVALIPHRTLPSLLDDQPLP